MGKKRTRKEEHTEKSAYGKKRTRINPHKEKKAHVQAEKYNTKNNIFIVVE